MKIIPKHSIILYGESNLVDILTENIIIDEDLSYTLTENNFVYTDIWEHAIHKPMGTRLEKHYLSDVNIFIPVKTNKFIRYDGDSDDYQCINSANITKIYKSFRTKYNLP